jgi:ornithine carbamoyltransferase
MAVVQLGGHPVYTRGEEIGFDVREPVEDVARILAGYHGVLTARVFDHSTLDRMRAVSSVPVVNLLSDRSHPLQAVADVLAMQADLGDLAGRTVAWVGDTNNVAHSLTQACVMLGAHVRLACPDGFGPSDEQVDRWRACGSGTVTVTDDPAEAVRGAHAVHTDTWVSMGQETEKQARLDAFGAYRVTEILMALAATDACFYHCLPAYRGLEVDASVIDGPRSRVIPQGHRRLDAARAVLAFVRGVRP